MASQTPIPQTPIPPGAMIPMQQQRPPSFAAKVCSYCLGDPAGGPDGHLYRSCILFLTGQQSRNPKWNYAASGPANFLAPGQAGNLPGNSMMPMPVNQHLYPQAQVQQPVAPVSAANLFGCYPQQIMSQSAAVMHQSELGELLARLNKIEERENAAVAKELEEVEKKKKQAEWDSTMTMINKSTEALVKAQLSPVKKCFAVLEKHYGNLPPTPATDHRQNGKRKLAADEEMQFEADEDSVFVFSQASDDRGEIAKVKTAPMLALFAVKNKDEWTVWVEKHLQERTDRSGKFLLSFAESADITIPKGVKKVSTIIDKIGDHFEAA
jgi:hypothetical protein